MSNNPDEDLIPKWGWVEYLCGAVILASAGAMLALVASAWGILR